MSLYTVFKDKTSKDLIVISKNSLEYPDYLALHEQGYCEKLFEGTKRECNTYRDELINEEIDA